MDDASKQRIAEERYKQFRTEEPEEYNGDFNSPRYREVQNLAIKQTQAVEQQTFRGQYKEDFDSASRDYWQKNTQTGLAKYNAGCITAKFGKDISNLGEFLDRVGTFVKESITNELIGRGVSTDGLQENFKAVQVALKLLAKSVDVIDPDFNVSGLAAYLQGFINTYVTTVVKQMERDKGKL